MRAAGDRLGSLPVEHDNRFPGESEEYRRERNRLLEAELELRRATERVAAQRRALPPGGVVPEDYVFERVGGAPGEVHFSALFAPRKDTLVTYNFMFPRHAGDTRPGPVEGRTAELPLDQSPCPSCTSMLDSLDGAARHLNRELNLAVIAKADPQRIADYAHERGWRNLQLLSSHENRFNRDYGGETADGHQMPMLNVFVRDGDAIRHSWGTELIWAPSDEGEHARHVDSIWPLWNVLDLVPGGRETAPDFPGVHY